MKKNLHILFATLFVATFVNAQEIPSFLVYNYSPAIFNAGYTGLSAQNQTSFLFSREIIGTDSDPTTYHLNYGHQFKNNLSVGLSASNSRFNIQNNLTSTLDVAYKLQLNEKQNLYFGIKAGIHNFSNKISGLQTNDDPSFHGNDETFMRPVLGLGVVWKVSNFYISLSIPNVIVGKVYRYYDYKKRVIGERTLDTYLNTGYSFKISNHIRFSPKIFVAYLPLARQSATLSHFLVEGCGVIDYNNKFELSGGFGTQKKVFASAGFNFSWGKIAYAYDYYISNFSAISQGVHGFMLQARL